MHPGVLVTRPMLDHMRANVQAKKEPTWSAYKQIIDPSHTLPPIDNRGPVWLANISYRAKPEKLWIVNASLSPGTRWLSNKEDSLAAYTHALLWAITQDPAHAKTAAAIMDAWSAVLTRPVWAADGLEAAWSGTVWARAAEIIKHGCMSDNGGRRRPPPSRMLNGIYSPGKRRRQHKRQYRAGDVRGRAAHRRVRQPDGRHGRGAGASRQPASHLKLARRPSVRQRFLARTAPAAGQTARTPRSSAVIRQMFLRLGRSLPISENLRAVRLARQQGLRAGHGGMRRRPAVISTNRDVAVCPRQLRRDSYHQGIDSSARTALVRRGRFTPRLWPTSPRRSASRRALAAGPQASTAPRQWLHLTTTSPRGSTYPCRTSRRRFMIQTGVLRPARR